MNCINKNSKEFKELVDLVGYDNTIAYYIAQGFTFVDESVQPDSVKPGVSELFESNPELANEVYKALEFETIDFELIPYALDVWGKVPKQRGENIFVDKEQYSVKLGKDKGIDIRLTIYFDNENKTAFVSNIENFENDRIHPLKKGLGLKAFLKASQLIIKRGYTPIIDNLVSGYGYDMLLKLEQQGYLLKVLDKVTSDSKYDNVKYEKPPFVFTNKIYENQITPQQKQQALQLYSQYLDTIFPDSKVKDIVYHGTPDGRFDSFDITKAGKVTYQSTQGIYFTDSKKTADFYAEGSVDFSQFESLEEYEAVKTAKVFNVLLNVKELKLVDSPQAQEKQGSAVFRTKEKLSDKGFVGELDYAHQYIVFNTEQIHILGSKQDIQGFKDFVQSKQFQKLTQEEKAKTIEQVTKEHRSIIALKDLAAKLAHRIGGKVEFVNKTDVDWKGYNQGMTSVLNEAYMDESTTFHEIMGHPIIRAIKNNKVSVFKDVSKSMSEIEIPDNLNEFTTNSFGYRKINNEWYQIFNGIKGEELKKVSNETAKYSYAISREIKETPQTKKVEFKEFNQLYRNLLKELETGRGKEVFEQVKRDYKYKEKPVFINPLSDLARTLDSLVSDTDKNIFGEVYEGVSVTYNNKKYSVKSYSATEDSGWYELQKNSEYTLEEQQEEAIVTLLGLMAADKLDAKKDATLISKLKEFWKQISDFVKQLLLQDKIIIDALPITTTLNDLAEIMAYGNNKIILPGYKVEYSTPLGNKYDTLEEVNNEIRDLADADVEVDLSGVKVKNDYTDSFEIVNGVNNSDGTRTVIQHRIWKENGKWYNRKKATISTKDGMWKFDDRYNEKEPIEFNPSEKELQELYKQSENYYNIFGFGDRNNILDFIERNKEYEQSREIIEQWKKENNIQYDPEEVYSRGQGFYSSIGAYSNLELDLLLKNLIQHIEDNKKAGGEFTISAFTKPIDKRLKHIEGTGDRVRFVIYPKSEHIKWAAPTDVYSGSVWDAHEKVSKDKKSELLGVSFTKAPALRNINEVSPNLADIIDNLSHAHNELGIELTTNNFRIEYDDNIDYATKKLIDNINKILDDKHGKLEKPEIKREGSKIETYGPSDDGSYMYVVRDSNNEVISDFETYKEAENYVRQNITKQPTLTRENTTSIESVRDKIVKNYTDFKDLKTGNSLVFKEDGFENNKVGDTIRYNNNEYIIVREVKENSEFPSQWELKLKEKDYTSQAEINLKIAALKEVARKYPRSLIASEIKPIDGNKNSSNFNVDDLYFQKLSNNESKGTKLTGAAKKNAAKALGLTTKYISWNKLQKVKKRVKNYNNANKYNKLFVQTEYSVRNNQSAYSWEIYDSGNKQIDMFDDVEPVVQTPEIKIVSPIVEERLERQQIDELNAYRDVALKLNEDLWMGINRQGDSTPFAQTRVGPEYINPNTQRTKYEAFVQNYNSEYGKNITGYEFLVEDENENIARISDYKDFMDYLQSYNLKGLDIRDYNQGVYNFETSRKEPPKNDNFDLGLDPISGLPVPPKC